MNADGNIMEEVNIRIGKAAGAFKKLRNIWKIRKVSRRMKYKKETSTKMYTPFYIGFNLQYGTYAHFGY